MGKTMAERQEEPNVYKDEVLGRYVSINFLVEEEDVVRPFLGQIREMNATWNTDTGNVMIEHRVYFDDGDKVWFDLAAQEESHRLTWISTCNGDGATASICKKRKTMPSPDRPRKKHKDRQASTEVEAVASAKATTNSKRRKKAADRKIPNQEDCLTIDMTSDDEDEDEDEGDIGDEHNRGNHMPADDKQRAPQVVSPEPCRSNNRSGNCLQPEEEDEDSTDEDEDDEVDDGSSFDGDTATNRSRSSRFNDKKDNTSSFYPDWITDMSKWLLTVPHGKTKFKKIATPENAQKVIRQVKKLVLGEGITYKNWPQNVCFQKGVKVDLSFDFETMWKQAKDYEKQYGEDKGHGWVVRHPIMKLQLYQEYRNQQQKRKKTQSSR